MPCMIEASRPTWMVHGPHTTRGSESATGAYGRVGGGGGRRRRRGRGKGEGRRRGRRRRERGKGEGRRRRGRERREGEEEGWFKYLPKMNLICLLISDQ